MNSKINNDSIGVDMFEMLNVKYIGPCSSPTLPLLKFNVDALISFLNF